MSLQDSNLGERIRIVAGLIIASSGVALVPIGWYFSRMLWIGAAALVFVGLVLLLTNRVLKSEREIENTPAAYARPVRPSVPGDVHNYSGWRDAGRSSGGGDSGGDLGGDGGD
jgi:uncharacterized protein (DUF58 family)